MSFWFGDGFDLYAASADALLGYWDSGQASLTLGPGRFSGSRAITPNGGGSTTNAQLLKNSGSNDSIHHIFFSIYQTSAVTGTSTYWWFTLMDGTTSQCSIVFRSDGAILLTAGISTGTTLATYTGAITTSNVWYTFEVEIVVSNTNGSMTVRKNGNTSNDFASATNLDTAQNANNYANRLSIGNVSSSSVQYLDDLLWRSDSTAPAWVGDIRCYTRRPVSDVSAQWTRSGSVVPQQPYAGLATTTVGINSGQAWYIPFTPSVSGTIGSVTMTVTVASTANLKAAIYASGAGFPTTVLATATVVSAPPVGTMTFTFASPATVVAGTQYFFSYNADVLSGQVQGLSSGTQAYFKSEPYASFPVANPSGLAGNLSAPRTFTAYITPTTIQNAHFVNETYQDAATTYIYSSTVTQSDLYNIDGISATPTNILGVTTRALAQKSDAGTRIVAAQLKSGSSTVESAATALNTVWGWLYRSDQIDPGTGAAWTAAGVNSAQIGVVVKS